MEILLLVATISKINDDINNNGNAGVNETHYYYD